jgi:hypothetical protein
MRTVTVRLEGTSPYSQSRFHNTAKTGRASGSKTEPDLDYRERTWREHLHYDKKTLEVFIPPMALKNCLSEVAKYISMSVPGRGKATFTKNVEAGILVVDPTPIGIKRDDVECEDLFLPSDGKRGSGKRVWKKYPLIREWKGTAKFLVLDDVITNGVFETHLREAGNFIGIGRFRPRQNGFYGRFKCLSFDWEEQQ